MTTQQIERRRIPRASQSYLAEQRRRDAMDRAAHLRNENRLDWIRRVRVARLEAA